MRIAPLLLSLVLVACASDGGPNSASAEAGPATTTTGASMSPTTATDPATSTTTLPPLSVAGKVIGPDGEPVARARIEIFGSTTTTGSDGFFALETKGPGTLMVTRPGWSSAEHYWDHDSRFAHISIEPRVVRGLRVGAGAAGDDALFGELLALAEATAVNAFVFDTKQEGGKVLYDTSVQAAHDSGAVDVVYDPFERLAQARDAGLYTITRITVFEDSYRVAHRPEEKLAGIWVDPRIETAWDYNIALAVEACELGFDEIQFDYVRFPSGRTAEVSGQLSLTQAQRVAAIEGFLSKARERLHAVGCAISADIFGIVVSVTDDQGLGQRPEEISRMVDAVSPMVYPSHYSPGWLGFSDPNDHPYDVTADAIDDALPRMAESASLRPWLQAFWWSNDQIRRSIQAAEDRGVGWILWNVSSDFDAVAIPTDEELSSPG
jgi:hypothetical protein